jgi:CheY-like chemotaxis protein
MDKSILVVDDEPQILSALKRTLRKQSYSVLFANDGHEALDILKQHEVDLILSDYMMPGLSGTELLTQAEKIQPNTVRIILSGHSDFQTVLESIKEGVVHKFLAKPWTNDVLIEQINKALDTGSCENEVEAKSTIKRESTQPTASVFNQTFDIILTLENKISSIAPELAELFEYNVEDICGQDIAILLAEKSYQQHQAYLAEKISDLADWQLPVKKRIGKTQHNAFLSIELAMVFTPEKIICSITPLQGLAHKSKGLDSILKSIQGPYLLIDKSGNIRNFNDRLLDFYQDFQRPEKSQSFKYFISSCIEKGAFPDATDAEDAWFDKFYSFDEDSNEHRLTSDTWIKIKATRAPEGAKILLHFDITEKKQMQLSLQAALLDAKQAKEEKAEVLESVQKDILAPMKDGVMEPLSQLKDTELDFEQKNHLENALESGSQILSNIDNITQKGDD